MFSSTGWIVLIVYAVILIVIVASHLYGIPKSGSLQQRWCVSLGTGALFTGVVGAISLIDHLQQPGSRPLHTGTQALLAGWFSALMVMMFFCLILWFVYRRLHRQMQNMRAKKTSRNLTRSAEHRLRQRELAAKRRPPGR